MVLILSAEDVEKAWQMPEAVEAMESLCLEEAAGRALSADRIHLKLPTGFMRILPGVLPSAGVLGYKEFHSGADGMRYYINLFDCDTGAHLAMLDGSRVTTVRTGAMGAVGIKHLTSPGCTKAGILGSGKEASTALEGLMLVRPGIRSIKIFSPTPSRREAFAERARAAYGVDCEATDTPQLAIADAEIVISATQTGGRVALYGDWLESGQHLNSIASTAPEQREIDPRTWMIADRIFLDTPRLLDESGDAIAAQDEGAIASEKVHNLYDVVAGRSVGRESVSQITMYKSVGTGLQDVAAAARIYETSRAVGLGRNVEPFLSPVGMGRPAVLHAGK